MSPYEFKLGRNAAETIEEINVAFCGRYVNLTIINSTIANNEILKEIVDLTPVKLREIYPRK